MADIEVVGGGAPLADALQEHGYVKGKAINLGVTPLGSTASTTADLITAGYATLSVFARIGNGTTPATASGDLSLFLFGYEDDGTSLFPGGSGATLTSDFTLRAASFGASQAYIALRYILGGVDKVQVKLTNSNVAALQGATVIYYLQK